jgi:cobalamin biosynthetic protein CobC
LAEWTTHGGRLGAARARWPDAPAPWLDLSTGINPHAWPVERAGPIDWRRLPDEPALAELEAAAAATFGVRAQTVCATPGSEIALRLLAALDLPRPHRFVAPGYRTHSEAFAEGEAIDPDAITTIGDGTLLLARPANPQGAIWPLPRAGVRLIIDEAFADATPDTSILPHPGAIILRSFGKFFGLAGVRLGFVVAPAEDLRRLRRSLGSWPVSGAAIAIGTAAYRDLAWQERMRSRLAQDRDALDRILRKHGMMPEGQCPLFRLVRIPDAAAIFERLARQGILTRPFDHAPDWLRFGLPGDAGALDRLDRALGAG